MRFGLIIHRCPCKALCRLINPTQGLRLTRRAEEEGGSAHRLPRS